MNIFYLHSDPVVAAQMHNDSHCVKMILESAQMLSTAHRIIDGKEIIVQYTTKTGKQRKRKHYQLHSKLLENKLYSATHINHPCNVWIRETTSNYSWLYDLFISLGDEYTYRYGKVHKSIRELGEYLEHLPIGLPIGELTQPPQAMPEYLRSNNSIKSYRNYYIHEKNHIAKWTKRDIPEWFSV